MILRKHVHDSQTKQTSGIQNTEISVYEKPKKGDICQYWYVRGLPINF